MKTRRVLIYGAGGHTGRLIARRLQNNGVDVVVAGRPSGRLEDLARSLSCEWRTASIDDKQALADMLRGVGIVVNASGPLTLTASPLTRACIASRCHYMDVGGEALPFEWLGDYHTDAQSAGVMVVPSVGFCVVVSTLLMLTLASRMRNPIVARVAFEGGPASSVGSMKSLYASLYGGVMVVQDRAVTHVPIGSLERAFEFKQGRLTCTAITVADTIAPLYDRRLASVRQIESYVEGSDLVRAFYASSGRATRISKVQPWKDWVDRAMARWPATPDSGVDTRASVVVEMEDPWRTTHALSYESPSTYDFTAKTACLFIGMLLSGMRATPGFHTPGSLFSDHRAFAQLLGSAEAAHHFAGA